MPTRDEAFPEGTPCWIDCQVNDTGVARAFYSALFGWDLQDGPEEYGGYLMAMKDGRAAAGIGPKPEQYAGTPSVWTTYLAAQSADATADRITDAGGQTAMPAFDVGTVGRMTMASDPTGAWFGIWEAKEHSGAQIFNEPGSYCWNELHTRDYETAKKFYSDVFGYSYTGMQGGEEDGYATFSTATGGEPVGGIADDTKMPDAPADAPAHWLTWFAVADVAASTDQVGQLGGRTLMGPADSPVGKMSVVTGPEGEVFGLIELAPPPTDEP